jgi:mono/diheme cytochrome c family protein
VNVRSIFSHGLAWLVVGSLTVVACDKPDAKDAKADEKKADGKNDATALADTKADAKALDAKAGTPAADVKADPKDDAGETESGDPADTAADAGEGDAKADDAKPRDPKPDAKKPDTKKPDTKKPDDEKPSPGSGVDGKAIFAAKCKSCHGIAGDAKTKIGQAQKIADWTQPGWKAKWPKTKIVDIVTNGKSGTKMKPFKAKLTAAEINAVAEYSRKLGK